MAKLQCMFIVLLQFARGIEYLCMYLCLGKACIDVLMCSSLICSSTTVQQPVLASRPQAALDEPPPL